MATKKKMPEPAVPSSIRLTAHPPERHRRGEPVILASGCCCCCCCCLHSLGGLIGAIIGSVTQLGPPREPADLDFLPPSPVHPADTRITTKPADPDHRITAQPADQDLPSPLSRGDHEEPGPPVSGGVLYWLLLSFLLFLGFIWFLAVRSFQSEDFLFCLLIGLIFLPGFQLGASILSATAAVLFYANPAEALARIGYITQYSVIGTLIGLGVMFLYALTIR